MGPAPVRAELSESAARTGGTGYGSEVESAEQERRTLPRNLPRASPAVNSHPHASDRLRGRLGSTCEYASRERGLTRSRSVLHSLGCARICLSRHAPPPS